jgi:hypothetical protein
MIDDFDNTIPTEKYKYEEESPTYTWYEGMTAAWELSDVSIYGEGVSETSREDTFKVYPDYQKNKKYYNAYADNTSFIQHFNTEDKDRAFVEQGIESGRFTLNAKGEVVDSKKTWASFTYDYDMIKGALLAKQNGWSKDAEKAAYKSHVQGEVKRLTELASNNTFAQSATGVVGSFIANPWFALEVGLSPGWIAGKTIAQGALLSFGAEFTVAALGEIGREAEVRRHKDIMDEEYGLWESTMNVLVNASIAGFSRAAGSVVADKWMLKGIKEEVAKSAKLEAEVIKAKGKSDISTKKMLLRLDGTDRDTLKRFVRREEYKLTQDTNRHIDAAYKAEYDLNKGNKVDIEEHLDIDGDVKFNTHDVEEISLGDEVKMNFSDMSKAADDIAKEVDDVKPIEEISDADPYEGRASKEEGEALIREVEMGNEFDEIETQIIELKAKKKLSPQAEKVKDTSEPTIGGSEEEAKQAVKDLFKKDLDPDARYKNMSKADLDELDRIAIENELVDDFGNPIVFSKFADNIVAGTIAGVEEDENGNITFNPEKFVLGLGGYSVVKALLKNPNVQDELRGWAERAINELETKPGFDMLTGTQRVSENKKGLLVRQAETKANSIEPKQLPDEYTNLQLSETLENFFKRAIPKKEELKNATVRYIAKKQPQPKKLYRGEVLEGEERIGGGAKEGYGLYTTVDKKLAGQYGHITEMNPATDLPKKPLIFSGMNEFEVWEQTIGYNVLKYKRLSEKGSIPLNEMVNLIDPSIDGIQIGRGVGAKSGTYWVKFPPIEDFRNFGKPTILKGKIDSLENRNIIKSKGQRLEGYDNKGNYVEGVLFEDKYYTKGGRIPKTETMEETLKTLDKKLSFEEKITIEKEQVLKRIEKFKNIASFLTEKEKNNIVDIEGFLEKSVLLKATARQFKKMGLKPYHISKKNGDITSYYFDIDGKKIRISDHELPSTRQRALRSGLSNFDEEIITDNFFDESEVKKLLSLVKKEDK